MSSDYLQKKSDDQQAVDVANASSAQVQTTGSSQLEGSLPYGAAMQRQDAAPGGEGATYVVRAGDNLTVIARRFSTTVAAIVQANDLPDANRISIGQRLIIPTTPQSGQENAGTTGQQGSGEQQGTETAAQQSGQIAAGTAGQEGIGQLAGDTPYNATALDTVAEEALAVVPEDMREYAQTAVPTILRQCAARGIRDLNQVAYILATAQHESRFGRPLYSRSESLVEDRNPFRQNGNGTLSTTVHTNGEQLSSDSQDQLETDYWDSAYGGRLGNAAGTTDARNFRGRGYVQLTGRDNYANQTRTLTEQGFSYTVDGVTYGGTGNPPIDLEAHPDHVNRVPDLAARIMVSGMESGGFTGRGLGDYVNENQVDFVNARRVVNGDVNTNGQSIADLATTYQGALANWATVFAIDPAEQPQSPVAPAQP